MNGRVYDASLGRFLSADPFIQAGSQSQNYNRYSYVMNNPLKYSDPSGHFFKKLFKSVTRAILSVSGVRAWWKHVLKPALVKIGSMPVVNVVAQVALCTNPVSCVAYAVLSTYAVSGDFGMALKAGVVTAATIAASSYIRNNVGVRTGIGDIEATVRKAVAHGAVGGTTSVVQGGKFGQGFASSFFTKLVSPGIAKLNGGESPTTLQKFTGGASAALVGGTASAIGGGKFANGAKTAMIQYLYNEVGKRRPTQNSSKDQEGSGWLRPDGHKYVVGRDNHPLVWSGEQGPGVGSFIDDYAPAGHTFGTNHDAFVELMVDQIGIPDVMVNIPSMPPIYIFSVVQEAINTPFRAVDKYFGTKTVPYEHSH